jgi:hypothetical protein
MRRRFLALAGATALVAGVGAASASADPQGFSPDCFGENAAYFAQSYTGVSDAAAAFGLTVPEGHNIVMSAFCGRTNGVVPIPT